MIKITDKRKCSGCLSCVNTCPLDAIKIQDDEEGFCYPIVNERICIQCGKCNDACPYGKINHGVSVENMEWKTRFFAAQLRNKDELFQVSSGGVFWALAQCILQDGGIVYGAVQDEIGKVRHLRAETIADAKKIRRSKYLQSDVGKCYRHVREDLRQGGTVLFSGTGCQIAGLYGYLGRSYDKLYTCEVVCHGVPSKKVWESYQKEKEIMVGSPMKDIVYRDKSLGWSRNHYKITFDNGFVEHKPSELHVFHAGYLQGLFYRPSCGVCPFASIPRVADLTLADYWSYKGRLRPRGEDVGVSLVVINNLQGESLFTKSKYLLSIDPTDKQTAIASCRHLTHSPLENVNRKKFIDLVMNEGYYSAARKYIDFSQDINLWRRIKDKIKLLIKLY